MSNSPSPDEMLASLRRSGYLLESRIVTALDRLGLFVESSAAYLDKKTGISREIDVVGETFRYNEDRVGTCVKTTFVIEAVNNSFPALVMTPHKWNPNTDEDDYVPFLITPPDDESGHPFAGDVVLPEIKAKSRKDIFCQYCGFSRKKQDGDLMASHPEDLYGSIKKAVEYALALRDGSAEWMNSTKDSYWRIFQWRPVVVFGGELHALREDKIAQEKRAQLRFNLHWEGRAKSVLVDLVTEAELPLFVADVAAEDDEVEARLHVMKNASE